MSFLGPLAFLEPWLLLGLLSLPVIWWLLRVTPPAPSRVSFPAIRILFDLVPKEETPARTPLWLLILRLLIAALVILALARPLLNPGAQLAGDGPVILVVDDGWAAAARWPDRTRQIEEILDQADRAGRPVVLLPTAPPASGDPLQASLLMPAADARTLAAALRPKPWGVDRQAAVRAAGELKIAENSAEVFWLSDGIGDQAMVDLAERLQRFGPVTIFRDPAISLAKLMLQPTAENKGLKVRVLRPEAAAPVSHWLRATGEQGRVLGREQITFGNEATAAEVTLDLPTEVRNRIVRLELEEEKTAGAAVLIDERFRRRPVGMISGGALEGNQPLLSEIYYIERALAPYAELRTGKIGDLLSRELAVLVLADIGQVVGEDKTLLADWLGRGGVLVRFAGPKLAASADDFVPVKLRAGGRALGGVLSWDKPAQLAPFGEASPFRGLAIPDEVTVQRQILAEPAIDLPQKTWVRLNDGTPLVTAEQRGDGWIVLFHITANTDWSNLPLSGLFVEMLRRVIEMSQGIATGESAGAGSLPPLSLLDGFGRLGTPGGAAQPVQVAELARTVPGPRHPPGYYGTEDARRAINVAQGVTALAPIPNMPSGIALREWSGSGEVDLMPWILAAALALAIADLLISLLLKGALALPRRPRAAAMILGLALAGGLASAGDVAAQQSRRDGEGRDAYAMAASLDFRMAHVLTGNGEVDAVARAGLAGLTRILSTRTSVEPGEPLGVDIERDDILFFPLLYWPVVPEQRDLSERALARIDNFLKTGGTILFDTRDQDLGGGFGSSFVSPQAQRLRQLLARLDLPPLVPVPEDHILTKAFYLMRDFPGRWAGGRVWVERHSGGTNDGVSSIIIGGNDWASAWAINEAGRPIAATVPGGAQQREQAYRFGVNLVMYTLTGNYKADQVHIPALLERLGQ